VVVLALGVAGDPTAVRRGGILQIARSFGPIADSHDHDCAGGGVHDARVAAQRQVVGEPGQVLEAATGGELLEAAPGSLGRGGGGYAEEVEADIAGVALDPLGELGLSGGHGEPRRVA